MAQIETLSGIINTGESHSNVIDVTNKFIVGLITPDDWDSAVASIMVSVEGDNYYDLFDAHGAEVIFNVIKGTMIYVDHEAFLMTKFLRLRSGTRAKPVIQTMTRRFFLVVTGSIATIV